MTIRKKILSVLIVVIICTGTLITSIWYIVSNRMAENYLETISESVMQDAYHAFEYILRDTSYMATLISLNKTNIVDPTNNLKTNIIKEQGQFNQEYLDNKRIIQNFINGLSYHKYYIVGISIMINEDLIIKSSSVIMENEKNLMENIKKIDRDKLITDMIMMDPISVEGGKSTTNSMYVVPSVRAIINKNREIVGYTILYFDYEIIETMFAANLPEGSLFEVINENSNIIYSNCDDEFINSKRNTKDYAYNSFEMNNVGWKFKMAIPAYYYISDIQKTTVFTLILLTIIFFVAILVLFFVITGMTREITALKESMNKVSNGNLKTIHIVKTNDEIGEMGHTFNNMVINIKELLEKQKEYEKQKRLNEMAFLQAQINPHFISNVLNMVVWMAKIQNADNIIPLINSLNSMLQQAMHQENDLIQIESEIEYVKKYTKIVELSGSYDFDLEISIDEKLKHFYMLRFILQPVVENSIYHGLPNDLLKKGYIKIDITKQDEKLQIIIEDNGNGMCKEHIDSLLKKKTVHKQSFNGIGIPNVNERIQLFFGEEYGLSYESVIGEYTKAIFIMPIIEME